MPCRVPKRRFSCGAPQHLTKNPFLFLAAGTAAYWGKERAQQCRLHCWALCLELFYFLGTMQAASYRLRRVFCLRVSALETAKAVPPWQRRLDFGEIKLRGKSPCGLPVLAGCLFRQ